MNKEDIIWYEEEEYVVMEEDGWKLLLIANHFKYKFWYEVQTPSGTYLNCMSKDIYKAIECLNINKRAYKVLKNKDMKKNIRNIFYFITISDAKVA